VKTEAFLSTYLKQVNGRDQFLFFAPGRVNLMGDHTDYTGGYVLPAAISLGTYLFVRLLPGNELRLTSENLNDQQIISLDNFSKPTGQWTDYPVGVLHELEKKGWKKQGLEMIYFGDVPANAGLSSSASIEMVTAYAVNTIFKLGVPLKELALLSQRAENHFVGVHCGIMDQYTSAMGKPGHALLIDCQKVEHKEISAELENYRLVAVNSNVKHALVNSVYNQRVEELQQVKQILNSFFEVPYLGHLTGDDYEWLDKLVESPLLKKRLRHVVNENIRTQYVAELLEEKNYQLIGRLMYDSHDSLASDFEVSCKELDVLVKIASRTEGVVGARMTGAGFGGCTLNLVEAGALPSFQDKIATDYKKETGLDAVIYPLSLDGETKMVSK